MKPCQLIEVENNYRSFTYIAKSISSSSESVKKPGCQVKMIFYNICKSFEKDRDMESLPAAQVGQVSR